MPVRVLQPLIVGLAVIVVAAAAQARQFDVQIVDERVVITDSDERVFGTEIRAPQFCPYDSNWLCFETRKGQSIRLFVYNRADAAVTEIKPSRPTAPSRLGVGAGGDADVKSFDFHWRPVPGPGNDRWFVFTSDAAGGSLDLWLGEARSGKTMRLKNRHAGKAETGPKWSPDGEVIAYVSDAYGGGDIYIIPHIKEMFADSSRDLSSEHHQVVKDPGLDYEIRWYPGKRAGYFAYTHQDPPEEGTRLVETRICDAVNEKTYKMEDTQAGLYLRSASWTPTGRGDLAFYQTDEYPEEGKEVHWGVGMAKVELDDPQLGTVKFRLKSPGSSRGWFETGVRTSEDLKFGPVWMPDGRFLALTRVLEEEGNPLWLYDISDWEFGLRHRSDRSFAPAFKHPHDLTIMSDQIAFTYIDGPNTKLLTGRLTGANFDLPDPPTKWPLYTEERGLAFYDKYIERPTFFEKLGRWATSPVVGPNIGINSNIVFWPGAIAAIALIAGSGEGPSPVFESWNPPGIRD